VYYLHHFYVAVFWFSEHKTMNGVFVHQ